MNVLGGFIRLIRTPNLFFIGLTQLLFFICIILQQQEINPGADITFSYADFILLMAASVLIAAGGYVINDYFDLNIDRINKPKRLVIERVIKRRWAILWHLGFSLAGLIISVYLSWKSGNPLIGIINFLAVVLLWFYSTNFKRQLLIGNIIISLLTAWVVLVMYVFESKANFINLSEPQVNYITSVFKMAVLYGGFAFIISLIREVVKDIEDMQGDMKYNCKTLPIVWGLNAAKLFVSIWLIVLVGAILILQVYALQLKWYWMVLYNCVTVLIPLLVILSRVIKATQSKDFSSISALIKTVMLAGILSMLFFKYYY
jgi:4-hydroxybenzoate polyprenyltransferase